MSGCEVINIDIPFWGLVIGGGLDALATVLIVRVWRERRAQRRAHP